MEGRALGKGLSALIPERSDIKESTEGIVYLSPNLIRNNRLQPRTDYDDQKLLGLKESIKEKGILQPILVRKTGDWYEVVAGERRLRAAKELGLTQIPVLLKELTDKETLVIALIENIQREELNAIEEALAYKKLIEEFGYTQENVAQSVGKDRTTIANLLRILNLPNDIQKSVYDGKLSVGHARALLSAPSAARQQMLYIEAITNGLSVRDIERMVKEIPQAGLQTKEKNRSISVDHNIIALQDELQKALGTKVLVKGNNKKGKVVIEYYSLDDLDRIIGMIKK